VKHGIGSFGNNNMVGMKVTGMNISNIATEQSRSVVATTGIDEIITRNFSPFNPKKKDRFDALYDYK
jgi:hypothetical protein